MPRRYVCRCFSSCAGADPSRTTFQRRTIVKHLEHDRQRQADLIIKAGSDVPPALAHAIDVWAPTAFDEIAAVIPRVSRDQSSLTAAAASLASDETSSTADSAESDEDGAPDARGGLKDKTSVAGPPSSSERRKRPASATARSGEGPSAGSSKRAKSAGNGVPQPPLSLHRPPARPFAHGRQPTYEARYPSGAFPPSASTGGSGGGASGHGWPAYASSGARGPPERGYSSLRTAPARSLTANPATSYERPADHAASPIDSYPSSARQPAFVPTGGPTYLVPTPHEQAQLAAHFIGDGPYEAQHRPYDPLFTSRPYTDRDIERGSEPAAVDLAYAYAPRPPPPYASATSSFDAGTFSTGSPPSPRSLGPPVRPQPQSYDYVPLLPPGLGCPPALSDHLEHQPSWTDDNGQESLADPFRFAPAAAAAASTSDGDHPAVISTESIARLTHDDLLRNATYRDLFFDYLALIGRSPGVVGKAEAALEPVKSETYEEPALFLDLGPAPADLAADEDQPTFAFEPTPDSSAAAAAVEAYTHPLDQPLPPPALLADLPLDPHYVDGGPTALVSHFDQSPAASVLERLWAVM